MPERYAMRPRSAGSSWPPPTASEDETEEERLLRLEREVEAKRVSDAIDRTIDAEREALKRGGPNMKVLLLGQSESGKSTVLKVFHMQFAPKSFQAEAAAWRPIIHLNLVRSVNFILDSLAVHHPASSSSSTSSRPLSPALNDDLRRLSMRLAPLRQVEETLTKRLCGSTPSSPQLNASPPMPRYNQDRASEVSVRSGSGWKKLNRFRRPSNSTVTVPMTASDGVEDLKALRIIGACRDDMVSLWADPAVQSVLSSQDVLLEDQSGFFLSDVKRVARQDYTPTTDDILRARVHTIGAEEYHIKMETAKDIESGDDWVFYDVGGNLGQRATWAQFFDDVNVIIFLVPVSAFNLCLAEDPDTNRLADSMDIWKMICNILHHKLESGIMFSRYVTSYKTRENKMEPVSKYLVDQFTSVYNRQTSTIGSKRKLYTYLTCAINAKATAKVLSQIRDSLLVKALNETYIL